MQQGNLFGSSSEIQAPQKISRNKSGEPRDYEDVMIPIRIARKKALAELMGHSGYIDIEQLEENDPEKAEEYYAIVRRYSIPVIKHVDDPKKTHRSYRKPIHQRIQELEERPIVWKAIHAKLAKDMGL